jgi:hypothetical protein
MSQCPYLIKDAKEIGWFNCQHDEGHSGDHKPVPPTVGRTHEFTGKWFKPGDPPEPPDPPIPIGIFAASATQPK